MTLNVKHQRHSVSLLTLRSYTQLKIELSSVSSQLVQIVHNQFESVNIGLKLTMERRAHNLSMMENPKCDLDTSVREDTNVCMEGVLVSSSL